MCSQFTWEIVSITIQFIADYKFLFTYLDTECSNVFLTSTDQRVHTIL